MQEFNFSTSIAVYEIYMRFIPPETSTDRNVKKNYIYISETVQRSRYKIDYGLVIGH